MQHRRKLGFTIIELAVVISVIGILASIMVVGYGAWQKRTAENVVKNDLINVASAMESARNFGDSGYPATIPTSMQASTDVVLGGGGFNGGQDYCIQGTNAKNAGVIMYVTNTSKTPKVGNCNVSSGLVASWLMNGSASDASGNNNNGTVANATLTTGQNGNANSAYNFNGSSAYIGAGTNTVLAFSDNFTVSAWIRPTGYHTVGFYGLMNGIVSRGPATTFNYLLQVTNSTQISFIKRTGAEGIQFYTFDAVPTSLTNKWSHVAVTVKAGTARLYVDGTFLSARSVGPIAGAAGDSVYLGSACAGGSQQECLFIGSLDDVRIYNRSLSAGDVAALFTAGAQ